jgi:tetratricopeptide (TPR) repeat protein
MYAAHSGPLELLSSNAADTYYNLLVQGFRNGQLNVKREVLPGLARLADPYDPAANMPYLWIDRYPLYDMSYYKGKLYVYWGVTPALVLFWPYVALTGHYLLHKDAVVIFCAIGFLASVGLLRALWRRYFAEVSVVVVAACVLALGLATGVPVMLPRSEVYEVAMSCGYMLTMLALGAIWCALHEPERRCWWLAAASVAYGLAVGARPNLLFGAVILLVPVVQAWREQRPIGALLTAATGPILLIGLGLMLYNALRFDSPFEFGCRYQLSAMRQATVQYFSLRYLWVNFRAYFLETARWSGRFPFVRELAMPPVPPGHWPLEIPLGALTNIPLVWLTLAVPLVWRGRSAEARSILQGFLAAVSLLIGICALTICLYFTVCIRYEVDFLPALVLLAVVGILGLERALATPGAWLATPGAWLADRLVWRRAVRWGWSLLLGLSVVFNLSASAESYAETCNDLGVVLRRAGRVQEAIRRFDQALRIMPDYAEAHCNLGVALEHVGRAQEAIRHYQQALQIKPDYADAHNNLGIALVNAGRAQEASGHFEKAVQIKPDFAEAHNNLGIALARAGKLEDAIGHWEQALRIKPDYAEAHYNLGIALEQAGEVQEAIGHYQQALRINPDLTAAKNGLARLQAVQ